MTSGLFLSVDLSSTTASLALHAADGRLVGEGELPPGQNHSERLLGSLDRLLTDAGASLSSIDRFVTPSGPGSFTGLRIALASLKAFAMALDRPLETVSGAEARARAWAAENPRPGARLLAVSQVSRDEIARCELRFVGDGLRYVGESTVAPEALLGTTDAAATVVLVDERTGIAPAAAVVVESFPLRARHLAPTLAVAATRRTYASLAEWIDAAPDYFGGGRFR